MTVVEENKPEPVQNQEQTNTQAKTEEVAPQIKSEENQANWKAFREKQKKEREEAARKAKEDAERAAAQEAQIQALKLALEASLNKPQQPVYAEDETEEVRINKLIEQRIADREAKYEQERKQRELQDIPNKLKQAYNDFDKVCSEENFDYFSYHYPEIAEPFKHMPDSFEKYSHLYKAMKKFLPNADNKADAARAEKNLQKPGSASAKTGATATGQPGNAILTEERRNANWERMQRTMKGLT